MLRMTPRQFARVTGRKHVPDPVRSAKLKAGHVKARADGDTFCRYCQLRGMAMPCREFKFEPTSRCRLDFAWPNRKLAVERDGGNWINGGHNRGSGRKRDNDKANAAAVLGWRVMHYFPQQLLRAETLAQVKAAYDLEMQ